MEVDQLFSHAQQLHKLGMIDRAEKTYRKVLTHNPSHLKSMGNLAILLEEQGSYEEAEYFFKSILSCHPQHELTLRQLAKLYRHTNRVKESIGVLERILETKESVKAQWDLAFSYLLNGQYEQGWRYFDSRILLAKLPLQLAHKPYWCAEGDSSKTLLIVDEQGIGDSIQYLRFIPLVIEKPLKKIIFYGKPALKRLINKLFPEIAFFSEAEKLPLFDCYIPLMSLAKVFQGYSPRESIYKFQSSYVTRLDCCHSKVPKKKPTVALCWQGNADFKGDKFRSPGLKALLPLLAIKNVDFVSLQVGTARQQLYELSVIDKVTDLGKHIESKHSDVLTTFEILDDVDFVVTSDTSVAHMAGSLGKTGFVLLSARPDWRWSLNVDYSIWYPSLKLMRQPTLFDWESVVELVYEELSQLIRLA